VDRVAVELAQKANILQHLALRLELVLLTQVVAAVGVLMEILVGVVRRAARASSSSKCLALM
jgi:hypothetical protein